MAYLFTLNPQTAVSVKEEGALTFSILEDQLLYNYQQIEDVKIKQQISKKNKKINGIRNKLSNKLKENLKTTKQLFELNKEKQETLQKEFQTNQLMDDQSNSQNKENQRINSNNGGITNPKNIEKIQKIQSKIEKTKQTIEELQNQQNDQLNEKKCKHLQQQLRGGVKKNNLVRLYLSEKEKENFDLKEQLEEMSLESTEKKKELTLKLKKENISKLEIQVKRKKFEIKQLSKICESNSNVSIQERLYKFRLQLKSKEEETKESMFILKKLKESIKSNSEDGIMTLSDSDSGFSDLPSQRKFVPSKSRLFSEDERWKNHDLTEISSSSDDEKQQNNSISSKSISNQLQDNSSDSILNSKPEEKTQKNENNSNKEDVNKEVNKVGNGTEQQDNKEEQQQDDDENKNENENENKNKNENENENKNENENENENKNKNENENENKNENENENENKNENESENKNEKENKNEDKDEKREREIQNEKKKEIIYEIETIQKLFTISSAVEYFKEFLIERMCQENLLFFLEAKKFNNFTDSTKKFNQMAKKIYNKFIKEGSIFEVNIDYKCRQTIGEKIKQKEIEPDIFSKAQEIVYTHMDHNEFGPFKKSELYQDLLKKLKTGSSYLYDSRIKKSTLISRKRKIQVLNTEYYFQGRSRSASIVTQTLMEIMISILSSHFSVSTKQIELNLISQSLAFGRFVSMTCELQRINIKSLSPEETIVCFVNLYNTLLFHAAIVNGIPHQNEKKKFCQDYKYNIGGYHFSLDDIKNGILRQNRDNRNNSYFPKNDPREAFKLTIPEPKIHFALNSFDSPTIVVQTIYEQKLKSFLDHITKILLSKQIFTQKKKIFIPRLFQEYSIDFGDSSSKILSWISNHVTIKTVKKHSLFEDFSNIKFYKTSSFSTFLLQTKSQLSKKYGDF
ncbi:electron carrier/ protein disulfide oxidoreductase [Anaeramoeba flamelloides]|uniref:Electron carrier/ protein disulfide oxidoreductase n=1 Tax=Anaeramoeba flamelloides TaxID=1746091 RepID=A0ABQ8YEX3_9EUKA|nr:electron carrier/ protein disulfide oxidoreductase [Anaeramoeba flamelloides]